MSLQRHHLLPCAVAIVFGLLAWGGVTLTGGTGRISAIWFANGLLLGILLIDERRRWRMELLASSLANSVANLAVGDPWTQAIALALCNCLEVAISYMALRHCIQGPAELFTTRVLWRFIRWAVLAAPLLSGVLAAAVLTYSGPYEFLPSFNRRFVAHALGAVVVVPLVLAFSSRQFSEQHGSSLTLHVLLPYLLLVLGTSLIFLQSQFPFLFLIFPLFLWVVFSHGYVGSAVGVAIIVVISVSATVAQVGPFASLPDATMAQRVISLQLLLAVCVVTAYPICAMLTSQHALLGSIATREQQLRVIADHSRDVIIHTDISGKRTYVSPAIEAMLGYRVDEALGRGGSDAIHPEDRALFEREEAALAAGSEGCVASYRVRHRAGHYVWVEVTAKVIRNVAGVVTGWISTTRDISERKRIEQMKAAFVASVSHELRTPLTAITGAIGLAQSGKFGEPPSGMARLLELARTNGQRLSLLVNDILDFEKLTSHRMEFSLQQVEVDRLLEAAVIANEAYAQRFNVSYRLGLPCAAKLNVDAHRFQQVMANLLSNAAKFSAEGSSVEVAAAIEAGQCVIRVADQGCGIPQAFHAHLFERFSQADPSDRRSRAGTGLGMAIAKEMTEGMGGQIRFESEPGRGTTFFLSFPMAEQSVAA
jgi:PAS domain S-box-containing protein